MVEEEVGRWDGASGTAHLVLAASAGEDIAKIGSPAKISSSTTPLALSCPTQRRPLFAGPSSQR